MRYSISNIGWDKEKDNEMYVFLKENNIDGIEIAPTRIFNNAYDNLELSHQYAIMLKNKYNLAVSSMQSIWYGITQNIFEGKKERAFLENYTKKAILFAASMNIENLVFGCPKNRNIPDGKSTQECFEVAAEFFRKLGDFAWENGTNLSIEPNPVIYNTNFLNYTKDACEFVRSINSKGLKVNIDMGTVIYNKENPHLVKTYKNEINHIHISTPGLEYIKDCQEYKTLRKVLNKIDYDKYISVEMKNQGDFEKTKQAVLFMKEAF